MKLIASVLHLDRKATRALNITNPYELHKAIYSLFSDVRSVEEKQSSHPSGFLYADYGGNYQSKKILLLSNRPPSKKIQEHYGEVVSKTISPEFLQYDTYRFKVIVNPTWRERASRKLIPVKAPEDIANWFVNRSQSSWGFEVVPSQLQVEHTEVLQFKAKSKRLITLARAHVQGLLKVKDRHVFIESFSQGVGRGRAFGCGLLQIVPVVETPFD